jgi:hypothetical protein
MTRKSGFDQRPAHGKIRIIRRQAPYRMQMIGQHHHGDNRKRVPAPDAPDGMPQGIYLLDQQVAFAVSQVHRKKISPTPQFGASIVHRRRLFVWIDK